MPRNDALLYSGQTSSSRRAIKEKARKEIKAEKSAKLMPSFDVISEMIQTERDDIQKQLLTYIQTNTPPEDLKSTLLALKMYDAYLVTLKSKAQNILRHALKEQELIDEPTEN